MVLEFCKLQVGCMLIILYIAFIYCKERKRFRQRHKATVFDGLLALSFPAILFDGLTAYTVNHLETVDKTVNMIFHLFFLLSLDFFIFWLFLYMISITTGLPKQKSKKVLLYSPFVINVIVVVVNIPSLKYYTGELSNYSMGISAYTCFVMAGIYILLSMIVFFGRWRYIERHKRVSIFTYLSALALITGYQMVHPQSLLSSICVTIIIGLISIKRILLLQNYPIIIMK